MRHAVLKLSVTKFDTNLWNLVWKRHICVLQCVAAEKSWPEINENARLRVSRPLVWGDTGPGYEIASLGECTRVTPV